MRAGLSQTPTSLPSRGAPTTPSKATTTPLMSASIVVGIVSKGSAVVRFGRRSGNGPLTQNRVPLPGVLAASGRSDAARAHIQRVLQGSYRDHHVAYSLGAAYTQLGQTDEADRWLRTAVDTGFPCLPFFERDPLLEPLRRRAQFADLLAYIRARREVSLSAIRR